MNVTVLIDQFLSRSNALTSRNYGEALKDFASFRRKSLEASVSDLLSAGAERANSIVARYKTSMVGTRDQRGGLVTGRGLGPSTINLRLTVLRSLVKKARKAGVIAWELDVPSEKQEDVRDNRGPGLDTVNAMMAEARKLPAVQRERAVAILRLFNEVGLRRREIIGLDVSDVDFTDATVSILAKGRSQKRPVPVSKKTLEAIKDWIAVRPATTPQVKALFTNLIPGRFARISGPAVYLLVRGASDPVVNPKGTRRRKRIGPHKLRHFAFTTAAANAQRLGLSREAVQQFTGHRDARSVSRYIDAADDAARKISDANARTLD